MKGLLLAGGHGTRLRPLTSSGNKHMLPIGNRPMLFYGLEHLRNAGIQEVGIVLGPISEGVKEAVAEGSKFGLRVTYISQPDPKGLAHAVLISESFLGKEPFVMYLADNILDRGIESFVRTFNDKNADCVIGVYPVDDPSRFGVVEMNGGRIARLVEKPKEPRSNLALVGVYVFGPTIFEAVRKIKPSWRNELEITDAIQQLLQEGRSVQLLKVDGWWKDAGRAGDLLDANRLILAKSKRNIQGTVEDNTSLVGEVVVGEGSVVKAGSKLLGPLIIGKNCIIGPNTYVGPYTSVGDRSEIEESEVENTIVMEDCKIGRAGRIVESLLGRGSIITSSSRLPNGRKLILGESSIAEL